MAIAIGPRVPAPVGKRAVEQILITGKRLLDELAYVNEPVVGHERAHRHGLPSDEQASLGFQGSI